MFDLKSLTILKYSFSFLITLYAGFVSEKGLYSLVGLLELIVVIGATEIIARKNKTAAYIINLVLLAVYNVETLFMCFTGERLRLIMLENIGSIEALSGDFVKYGIGVLILVLFTCLPVKSIFNISKEKLYRTLSVVLLLELCITLFTGSAYSTFFSVEKLRREYISQKDLKISIENQPDMTAKFYKNGIDSYTDITATSSKQPNVVLIFVEGLSQHIIDDEREIMTHAKVFQSQSINFTNYFNHTAATYRGLISQLYSGYQHTNLDTNNLISLQSILRDEGYNTEFINTEPQNYDFTKYLNSLGFDRVVSDKELNGAGKTISDKHAFELMREEMERLDTMKGEQPFFISMYTFGTHNTLDSTDEKYGTGTDRVLNKFYNVDYQFGSFMSWFKESKFKDNTIIVFTTDHCTYNSDDYRRAFPSIKRSAMFMDTIPLAIFWEGVQHEDIDVSGRTSLDMAPTLLDIIGISAPNFFLGSSLYNPDVYHGETMENIYYADDMLTSNDGLILVLEGQRYETFVGLLNDYFIATQQTPQRP